VSNEVFFLIPRAPPQLRGHPYTLSNYMRCSSSVMHTCFSSRPINMWNYLLVDTTNFSSLSNFNEKVWNAYLLIFSKVNLVWLWSGYKNGFVVCLVFCLACFACFYVYTTILSTMQHVIGLQALCCSINLSMSRCKVYSYGTLSLEPPSGPSAQVLGTEMC